MSPMTKETPNGNEKTIDKNQTILDSYQIYEIKEKSRNVVASTIKKASRWLDSLGVEIRGIERLQPYERSSNETKQILSVIGLWLSGCGGLSSMSTFILGPLLFGLGLKNSLMAGLIGLTLGCAVAAYCSLMGPRSGCRQMVSARFLFGWWFVKLVCLVSIIGVMGWSVVNSVVGGQILVNVSKGQIPLVVGIVIVGLVSLSVAICGIRQLLKVEMFLSIPVNLAFMLLYVAGSKHFKYLSHADKPDMTAIPKAIKGSWLSFFSLCYSTTSTWGSIASDYYILFPETTSDLKVFLTTFVGILIPTTFVGVLGILLADVGMNLKEWGETYDSTGIGGLLYEAFRPWGAGGDFLLVVIFLSLVSNNILNTYSAAFGVQLIGVFLARIPRWLWAIILTAIYMVCALVGRKQFASILGNFLPMVGYWISMYFIMLLEENQIFRTRWFIHLYTKEFPPEAPKALSSHFILAAKHSKRGVNYNFNIWNDYDCLSRGLAATFSFAVGVVGAVLGMAQTYWVGPLARKVGADEGGDIAMWLCMGLSAATYPLARYWELKRFGR